MTQRILVVDDSPTQALKLQYALEQEGWEVVVAHDPDRALALLQSEQLDLAVVDYYLPGMRGDELCRLIRMNVDTRNLPLMMLTVAEDEDAERKGLESGADDYLPKSVDTEILMVRVRALLRKSQRSNRILDGRDYFGKGRILVVDDSLTYRQLLCHQLAEEGYEVSGASGAAEAIELLPRNPLDVVLVDLVMPGIDGIELCRQLNEFRLSQRCPFTILMLTAHEGKEEMTRGLEAGADDFVGKSCDAAVLRARIRALLRRKFFQEENLRISEELRHKELETLRARADQEAAEARAAMAEALERTNRDLEETNRRLRETQVRLIQSEKMASLGQLVAGIAHELNNPLAFVMSTLHSIGRWLDELGAEVEPNLDTASRKRWSKIHDRLGRATDGLERMKDLVLKLRTFSRLDEGEFKRADVHEGLESVLVMLGHRLKGGVEVVREFDPDGGLGCFPGQLNQVFMNLIVNAVDALEGPGTITLTTRRVQHCFLIEVSDTGRGLEPDRLHRIFEPFYTTKPVGQGTGMGLAISYGIVQAHHGTLEVTSQPGVGTTFTVSIPLDLEARLAAGDTPPN